MADSDSRMRLLLFLGVLMPLVAMETRPDINLDDVVALVGQKFEYQVGDEKFHSEYEIYKIVERGNRKLPDWLSFDKNTSLLVGVPLENDVALYTIRMRACFIEKTNTDCRNKISRSFQIDVVEPLRAESERGSHNVPVHAGNNNILMHRGSVDIFSGTMHEAVTNKQGEGHKVYPDKDKIYFRHCESNEITFYASLVLYVENSLSGFERVFLIDCMSVFLSKNVNAFSLSQYNQALLSSSSKYIITAGPGNVINSMSNSIELSWHVVCGLFEHVSDFSKVLQHNIDSGRLTMELGLGVIAWYVYSDRIVPKRIKRNVQRRQTTTPSFTPPLPSTMPFSDWTDSAFTPPFPSKLTSTDVVDSSISTLGLIIETSFPYYMTSSILIPVISSVVIAPSTSLSTAFPSSLTSSSSLILPSVNQASSNLSSTLDVSSMFPDASNADASIDISVALELSSNATEISIDATAFSATSLPATSLPATSLPALRTSVSNQTYQQNTESPGWSAVTLSTFSSFLHSGLSSTTLSKAIPKVSASTPRSYQTSILNLVSVSTEKSGSLIYSSPKTLDAVLSSTFSSEISDPFTRNVSKTYPIIPSRITSAITHDRLTYFSVAISTVSSSSNLEIVKATSFSDTMYYKTEAFKTSHSFLSDTSESYSCVMLFTSMFSNASAKIQTVTSTKLDSSSVFFVSNVSTSASKIFRGSSLAPWTDLYSPSLIGTPSSLSPTGLSPLKSSDLSSRTPLLSLLPSSESSTTLILPSGSVPLHSFSGIDGKISSSNLIESYFTLSTGFWFSSTFPISLQGSAILRNVTVSDESSDTVTSQRIALPVSTSTVTSQRIALRVSTVTLTSLQIALPVSSYNLTSLKIPFPKSSDTVTSLRIPFPESSDIVTSLRIVSSISSSSARAKQTLSSRFVKSYHIFPTLLTLSLESSVYSSSTSIFSVIDSVDIITDSVLSCFNFSFYNLNATSVETLKSSVSSTLISWFNPSNSSSMSEYNESSDYISISSEELSWIRTDSSAVSPDKITHYFTTTKSGINETEPSSSLPQSTPITDLNSFLQTLHMSQVSTDMLSVYPSFTTTTDFSLLTSQYESIYHSLPYSTYHSELYITTILLSSLPLILKSSSYFLKSSLSSRIFSMLSSSSFLPGLVSVISYSKELYNSSVSWLTIPYNSTSSLKWPQSAFLLSSNVTSINISSPTSEDGLLTWTFLMNNSTSYSQDLSTLSTSFRPLISSDLIPYSTTISKSSMAFSRTGVNSIFSTDRVGLKYSSESSRHLSFSSKDVLSSHISSTIFGSRHEKSLELDSSLPATSSRLYVSVSVSVIVSVSSSSVDIPSSVNTSSLRDFPSSVLSSKIHVLTTAIPDGTPTLQNPINQLQVHVGKYFEYHIPVNTFNDTEDGNTRNLSLSVTRAYGKPLPKGGWLMFNETSQILYGIPLWQDIINEKKDKIMTIILVAKDSAGQIAKDAIQLTYNKSHVMGHSHKMDLSFNDSFKDFMSSRDSLVKLARDIAGFYGDLTLDFLTFLGVNAGSLNLVWSNSSLAGEKCNRERIQEMFDKLVDVNNSVSEKLVDLFSKSDMTILSATLEFVGVCLIPVTSLAPTVVTNPPESSVDDDKIWIEVVIPALVAILVLVIIALILLICCRHRRSRKKHSKSEKPMFLEDRRPIIFPEELEMTDPNLKPKTPLVLPSDLISENPPPVPPHRAREPPHYEVPAMEEEVFLADNRPVPPPHFQQSDGSDPPPYRLPPPYFNPHRSNR